MSIHHDHGTTIFIAPEITPEILDSDRCRKFLACGPVGEERQSNDLKYDLCKLSWMLLFGG